YHPPSGAVSRRSDHPMSQHLTVGASPTQPGKSSTRMLRRGGEAMRISVARAACGLMAVMLTVLLALPVGVAAMQVGDLAPDFKLPATPGGMIRLSDFRGKQMVLIE